MPQLLDSIVDVSEYRVARTSRAMTVENVTHRAAPERAVIASQRVANARPMTGSAKQSSAPHRHCGRSEAIMEQQHERKLDCFVASPLAMTALIPDTHSHSRGTMRPSDA
jgi:hypothetical protein